MGISLKEALEKSQENIDELELEKRAERDELLKEVSEKLDKLISINISTILQKPINIPFSIPGLHRYNKDILNMYVDFTIYFSPYGDVSIKLADKEWDWNGYGTKKEEEPYDIPQRKNIFSRFLSKLSQKVDN